MGTTLGVLVGCADLCAVGLGEPGFDGVDVPEGEGAAEVGDGVPPKSPEEDEPPDPAPEEPPSTQVAVVVARASLEQATKAAERLPSMPIVTTCELSRRRASCGGMGSPSETCVSRV